MAWLIYNFGWRWAFVATGALGFCWLFGWQRLYDSPACHARVTPEELELIQSDQPARHSSSSSVRRLLSYKQVWGIMLARFVADGGFYFFTFWLPKYLSDVRGFDIKQIGMFGWIPFLAADIGSLLGGWLGTRLVKQGRSLNASRKLVMWLGTLLMPLVILNLYASSPYVGLGLIAAAMFATQIKSSAIFTIPADLVRAQNVALVWGLSGAAGSLGGAFFQLLNQTNKDVDTRSRRHSPFSTLNSQFFCSEQPAW
jgi:ACS family hexuronate transporter-like MFS transporter